MQGVRWLESFASRTREEAEEDQAAVGEETDVAGVIDPGITTKDEGYYDNVTTPLAWNLRNRRLAFPPVDLREQGEKWS